MDWLYAPADWPNLPVDWLNLPADWLDSHTDHFLPSASSHSIKKALQRFSKYGFSRTQCVSKLVRIKVFLSQFKPKDEILSFAMARTPAAKSKVIC